MSGRLQNYVVVCAYNVGGTIANIALIASFGAGANFALKAALALSVIAVAVISILPAKSIFDDMTALRADRPAEMEGSAFMANFNDSPHGLYTALTIGFNALVAAAQIWALFSI
jgi:hypothetical protein